jgi:hypothetical protein
VNKKTTQPVQTEDVATQSNAERTAAAKQARVRKGTLVDFFARSPLRGSGLKIERIRGGFRKVDLD